MSKYNLQGIAELCNKFDLHCGFMRVDQDGAKKCCQMGRIGCAILQVAQKDIVGIQVFFCNPLVK